MKKMNEEKKMNALFELGLQFYNNGDYFDAHEAWEDLWSDYYFKDRKFIQGLIQLSVSFVHLKNDNMIGAKNLLKKCKNKFLIYNGFHRGININELLLSIEEIEKEYEKLNHISDFNWRLAPFLRDANE